MKNVILYLTAITLISCDLGKKDDLSSTDKGVVDYIDYFDNQKIKSKGKVKESKRISKWEYYNSDGSISATGNYEDGLKVGIWVYSGVDTIDWQIYNSKSLELYLNLPKKWRIEENYNDTQITAYFSLDTVDNFVANGSILKITYQDDFNFDKKVAEISASYGEIISSKDVVVNGNVGRRIVFTALREGTKLIVTQVLLKRNKDLIVANGFSVPTTFDRYERLFNEIAFSLTLYE
jgi:hypothetical protein